MNEFDAIIDFGSKNLKLGVFNTDLENIYSSVYSSQNLEFMQLNILIVN